MAVSYVPVGYWVRDNYLPTYLRYLTYHDNNNRRQFVKKRKDDIILNKIMNELNMGTEYSIGTTAWRHQNDGGDKFDLLIEHTKILCICKMQGREELGGC